MKAFEYYAPAALEEAFDLLDRFEAEGKLLNGGTDVVIQLREKLIAPKAVIDIKRIPGLRGIAYDPEHGLTIGACVTMNELGNEALVCTHYPTLAKAALSVGSKQVRNRATCAGSCRWRNSRRRYGMRSCWAEAGRWLVMTHSWTKRCGRCFSPLGKAPI